VNTSKLTSQTQSDSASYDLDDLLGPDSNVVALNALDHPIEVTFSDRYPDYKIKHETITLRQFAERLMAGRFRKAPKAYTRMLKLGRMTGATGDSVECFSGVMGDYDAGAVSKEDAAERARDAGIAGVFYDSPSHTPSAPRWRVLVPLSKPTDAEGMATQLDRLNGALGGILGHESWRPAQRYHFGNEKGVLGVATVRGRCIDEVQRLPSKRNEHVKAVSVNKPDPEPIPEEPATAWQKDEARRLITDESEALVVTKRGEGRQDFVRQRLARKAGSFGAMGCISEDDARAIIKAAWDRMDDLPAGHENEFSKNFRSGWKDGFRQRPFPRPHNYADDFEDLAAADDVGDYDQHGFLWGLFTDKPKQKQKPKPLSSKKLIAYDAFKFSPATTYLIKGVLDQNTVSVVWGASNSGKTFTTLDMVHHMARGADLWRGRRVKQASVIYLALEGGRGIEKRILALKRENPGNLPNLYFWPHPLDLMKTLTDDESGESSHPNAVKVARMLHKLKGWFPDLPQMLVVDTLARAMPGRDENSTQDMGRLIEVVDEIRAETGAHVMIVHHSGKDEARGMRGASALLGAIDGEVHVQYDHNAKVGNYLFEKQRDSARGNGKEYFRLKVVDLGEDDDGDQVTSCVIDHEAAAPVRTDTEKLSASAKAALETLEAIGGTVTEKQWREACAKGRTVSASEDRESRVKAFKRAAACLARDGLVVFRDGFYRIPDGFDDSEDAP